MIRRLCQLSATVRFLLPPARLLLRQTGSSTSCPVLRISPHSPTSPPPPPHPRDLYAHYYRLFGAFREHYASLLTQWRSFFAALATAGYAVRFDPHWFLHPLYRVAAEPQELDEPEGEPAKAKKKDKDPRNRVASVLAQLDAFSASRASGARYPLEARFAFLLFSTQKLERIEGLFGCLDVYHWQLRIGLLPLDELLESRADALPLLTVSDDMSFDDVLIRPSDGQLYMVERDRPFAPSLMHLVRARTAALRDGSLRILLDRSYPNSLCYLSLFDCVNCPTAITRDIEVQVSVYLLPATLQMDALFCWSYQVRIRMLSKEESGLSARTVQLVSRRWEIFSAAQLDDLEGDPEVVAGPGVIGLFPILRPGDRFEYASLTTDTQPGGRMRGHFVFVDRDTRETFVVEVPTFQMNYDSWTL
mmetsp:Transcript_15323/g.39039  ORF Transcript_15323/g.39039 Transcript_15323/m.39039 type:complete len:418 (-) Transcript_15323:51-1304(-)